MAAMENFSRKLAKGFDILIVEDDTLLADTLLRGWPVPSDRLTTVCDYKSSIELIHSGKLSYFDGVIVDIYLPDGDGLEILRAIRAKADLPLILISGSGSSDSRAAALEAGADGYVMKPFAIRELQAMITRLIRVRQDRQAPIARPKFEIGGKLMCDLESRLMTLDDASVTLTDAEARILNYLYENSGRICSKSAIYKHAFYRSFKPSDKTLEVYIGRIRGKIARLSLKEAKRLQTARGSGYRLSVV